MQLLLLFLHQPCTSSGSFAVLLKRRISYRWFSMVLRYRYPCNAGYMDSGIQQQDALRHFEAGGLCMATILSACLKPVKTERARLRLIYATLIIVGYIIVTVSPVGCGASMASGTPLKHGVLKHGSDNQMLMSSVHGIVHGAQDEGNIRGKNLRGRRYGRHGRNDDVRRRRTLIGINPTVKKLDVNTPSRQPVLESNFYIDEFVSGPWAKQSVESTGKTYWWQASLNYCGNNYCPFLCRYYLHSLCTWHAYTTRWRSYGHSRKGQ